MTIKRLYFYNVWEPSRPEWVNKFNRSFIKQNDCGLELLDISNSEPLQGIKRVQPLIMPSKPHDESYRRVMFGHSLAKFWTILELEKDKEDNILAFDSDVIALRPLSELVAALNSTILEAPLIFLNREKMNAWVRKSENVPDVSLCSGKAWKSTGNMGAVLLNKKSNLWPSFVSVYQDALAIGLKKNCKSRTWRDDIGIIIDIIWPKMPECCQLYELGTLEKNAKATMYWRNPNPVLNESYFFHMEGDRKKDITYIQHVVARAGMAGLTVFRKKIEEWNSQQ